LPTLLYAVLRSVASTAPAAMNRLPKPRLSHMT
jgi:hypothetical protein